MNLTYGYMMDGWNGYGYNSGDWVWMFLMMVLFLVGIVLVLRFLSQGGRKDSHEDSALEILKKRYAKGEIDKKEYQEKLKELKD